VPSEGFLTWFRERKHTWRTLFAGALLLSTIAFAVSFGRDVGQVISLSGATRPWAVGLLSITFLIAALKEALERLPSFLAYVRSGEAKEYYKLLVFSFVTTMSISLAFVVIARGTSPEPPAPPEAPRYTVLFTQPSRAALSFSIPFGEEAAECTMRRNDPCLTGLRPTEAAVQFLDSLVQGLKTCATGEAAVLLEVRGFASSSLFADSLASDSLNTALANRRADVVAEHIRSRAGGVGDVRVQSVHWQDYAAMAHAVGVRDRDRRTGRFIPERGLMSRRVSVDLVDAGDCRLSLLPD